MKKALTILGMALFVCCSLISLSSCSSDDEEKNESCIIIDGERCVKLYSAFESGVFGPSGAVSYNVRMYDEMYSEFPSFVKETVRISFLYENKKYENDIDALESISVSNIPNVGGVHVNFNQGVFDESNDQVSSVDIRNYHKGQNNTGKGTVENSNIDIFIKLKNNKTMEIKYVGKIYPMR